jgi:hypothetical protein
MNSQHSYDLNLKDFLLQPTDRPLSEDVIEEGFDRLYMRKGTRYLANYNNGYYYKGYCITVAAVAVNINEQRKGLFKELIHKIKLYVPKTAIVVENVFTDYLIRHLHNNGWIDVFFGDQTIPPSFIDNISLLEKEDKVIDLRKMKPKTDLGKSMLKLHKSNLKKLKNFYKKIGIYSN